MSGAVEAYADEVVSRVGSSGALVVETIRAQGNSVADRLTQTTDAVTRDFSIRSNSLIDQLEAGGARLSTPSSSRATVSSLRINDATDRLHETVVVRGQVLEDGLTGSSEHLTTIIRDRAEDAAAVLDAAATRWGEQFDQREVPIARHDR